MTPALTFCPDDTCSWCTCHDHGRPDPLHVPDDVTVEPYEPEPIGGWDYVLAAVVAGALIAVFLYWALR